MSITRWLVIAFFIASGLGLPGCGSGSSTDGGVDAGSDAPPSACPGQLLFTGEYLDWDNPQSFMGVLDAMVTEVANPSNSDTTAHNGRSTLCLPAGITSYVDFTHDTYIDIRFTVSPDAIAKGPYSVEGLTDARAGQVFTQIGRTFDSARAQVLIAIYDYSGNRPAIGATATVDNNNEGGFVDDGTGASAQGTELTDDQFVFFANVDIGGGTTPVTVTPPTGKTCVGPPEIQLVAGQIAATAFACTD
ncbi:MAG: hypothetical protein MJE77_41460 [Proteobacteria bacterium]|nr:hypothetical protein [Pseudomonadota bacterium]